MKIKCRELSDGRFDLSFPYDEQFKDNIKALPYREWNPDKKAWTVNKEGLQVLQNAFQVHEYDIIESKTENKGLELSLIDNEEEETFKLDTENLPFINNKSYQRLKYIANPSGLFRIKEILEENGFKVKEFGECSREKTIQLQPNIQLYPYQEECVEFFREHNWSGINAMSMGLGKTFTSLMCFFESDAKNLMVVAPAGLLQQWADVIEESFGTKAVIVSSKTKKSDRKYLLQTEPLVITSFDILWREDYNINIQVDMLIIDEASRIKNWKTRRAQALHNIISKYRIALTGTPIENRLSELFNIADNTVPAFYGSLGQFYQEYTEEDITGKQLPLESLYEKNKELVFRKTEQDVPDQLPEKRVMEMYTNLSRKELNCADKIKESDKEAIGKLAMLKVHSSNPAIYMEDLEKSSKEELLEDILVNNLEGRKIVVFTQYTSNMPRFEKIADDNNIHALYLSGKNSNKLDEIRDKFVNEDYGVLFLSEVGEFGLDKLQVADVLINFDLPWNPSKLHQRAGRIHRLGSEHSSVLIINLVSNGTLDEYLIKVLNGKIEISTKALKGIKQYIIDELELENRDLKIQ